MQRRMFNQLAACAALGALARPALAAKSDGPVSLVVGYSAGGSADFVARAVGAELAKRLDRDVVVDNVVGGSGMLALEKVLQGPADGSVIYMGGTDTVVVPMVNPQVKRNWDRDLAPVGRMTTVPMILAVPAGSKYRKLSDLIRRLRAGGAEQFSFATPGVGTMQHLYGALINKQAGVEMRHMPYRGGAQIVSDLLAHKVDAAILVLSTALPHLQEGKIRALSVSDVAPVPQLAEVKRIGEEEGFGGLAMPLWQAIFVKAGTPAATVSVHEKALQEALGQPELRAKLQESGITPAPLKGKDLHAFIGKQAKLYQDIVSNAHIASE